MDCSRARSLLHPWLDGELPRDEHRLVAEHLERCEPCDGRFQDERRLLLRVKEGLATTCPVELRARLLAGITAAQSGGPAPLAPAASGPASGGPASVGRGTIISLRRALSAAAVLTVAFVWADPICLRGCPTVRALAHEHQAASPAMITSSTEVAAAFALDLIGEPVPECELCPCGTGLRCQGVQAVTCSKRGCMVFYKDPAGRAISFVKLKGAHVHAWLRFRARPDGLIVTKQDGCRFACWKDGDGFVCGLVTDETVGADELVALCEKVRGQ